MLKSLKTKTIHYFRPFHYLPKITTVNILVCILIKKIYILSQLLKNKQKLAMITKQVFVRYISLSCGHLSLASICSSLHAPGTEGVPAWLR